MEAREEPRSLWKLFTSILFIASFTFGGGFVIVSLMKKRFVDELHWITEQEMLDMTAMAQSSPGAIAVNGAILVGWHAAGLPGMVVSVLASILPPLVILSVISLFYQAFAANPYVAIVLNGMQAGVAAVILDVTFSLGRNVVRSRSPFYIAMMLAAFAANVFLRVNVILIVIVSALIGLVRVLLPHGKGADR